MPLLGRGLRFAAFLLSQDIGSGRGSASTGWRTRRLAGGDPLPRPRLQSVPCLPPGSGRAWRLVLRSAGQGQGRTSGRELLRPALRSLPHRAERKAH